MKRIKYLGLLGITGLLALLFLATPVSAQDASVTPDSVPAEVGSVSVSITGSGWGDATRVAITTCSGANGDPDAVTASSALSLCPGIIGVLGGNFDAAGGAFAANYPLDITQSDIDAGGIVVLVAAAPVAAGGISATVVVPIGGDSGSDSSAEGEEEMMDDEEEMMDDDEDLADTGLESGLLAIAGTSIIVAGLLFAGLGRKLRKN